MRVTLTLPLLLTLIVLAACAASQPPPTCTGESDRLRIGREYRERVIAECPPDKFQSREACPSYPAIRADYDAKRAAWVECR